MAVIRAAIMAMILAGPGREVCAQTVYTWNDGDIMTGNITPTGVTTVTAPDTLNITGGTNHDFNGWLVTNNGTVNWLDGNLRSGNGGSFTNNAAWNDSSAGSDFNNAFGGTGGTTFLNAAAGTYTKSAGVTTFSTVGFNNAGTINVTGGTLILANGGTFSNGSVAGSSGSGALQLVGGTLTATGSVRVINLVLAGGTLAGDHTFTNSVLSWQGGNMNSTNATTLAANTTVNIEGGNNHDFLGHTIINNGTMNWQAGDIRSGGGGTITNNGLWQDTSNGYAINNAYGGAGGTSFINAAGGTYLKTTGTTNLDIGLSNYGTVSVTGGVLNLTNGGTFYDGSTIGSSGSGVVQLTGGILTGSNTAGFTANNFVLTGGQVAGNITFLGTTGWTGSNFNTAGTATVGATGVLNILTGNYHDYQGHAMVNNGTVNWQAGDIRSGGGGTFTNNGIWNDSANGYSINNAYGGTGGTTFTNAASGTYLKTAGTTTFSDSTLVNNGVISVTGGALNLNGGILNNGSTIGSSGSGVVQLTAGTLTANGTIHTQNFLLNGGVLAGDQTFAGTVSWLNSNLNTLGSTTIASTSTLTIDTGAYHDYQAHTIVNNGTVNWFAGEIRSGSGGTFTNNGIFNDSSNGYSINNAYGGAGGTTFTNAAGGTYLKTAGTTTFSDSTLVNNGVISVTGGTLNLTGGTLNNGSTIGSSGSGVVQLTAGTLTANGTIHTQNFLLNGGVLAGDQTFAGTLSWLNTGLNNSNTTTIGATGALTIDTGSDHDFQTHTIVNYGAVNWIAGRLRSGSGGTITNNGTWNDSANGYAINNDYGGTGGTTFINAAGGIYVKTAGTTTMVVPLTNAGTINLTGGTLALQSSFANTGTVTIGSGATLSSTSPLVFGAGSALQGGGTLSASALSLAGKLDPGLGTTVGQLTLNSNVTLAGTAQVFFDLGGVSGAQDDSLVVNGSLDLGGALAVRFVNNFNLTADHTMTFTVATSTSLTNAFLNVANGARLTTADNFGTFVVNYGAGSPFGVNSLVLSNYNAIPEPSTWTLMLAGVGLLGWTACRRLRRG